MPDLSRLYLIEHDPQQGVVVPTVASLLVPGLGQVLLGQYLKALWVFGFCAPLALFCGVGNLLAAADAYSVASRIRETSVSRSHTSNWLIVPIWGWRIVRLVARLRD